MMCSLKNLIREVNSSIMVIQSKIRKGIPPLGESPTQIVPKSLVDYLEIQTKSVFQIGMSWKVVESKWPTIREAFHDFQIGAVAAMDK